MATASKVAERFTAPSSLTAININLAEFCSRLSNRYNVHHKKNTLCGACVAFIVAFLTRSLGVLVAWFYIHYHDRRINIL